MKNINLKQISLKTVLIVCLPLLVAAVSFFGIARYAASADAHKATIQALDDKKKTVLELTAASTAASAAITLIPGDTGTPIAEKLADLSGYFLIVLSAIFFEKYMVTILGFLVFKFVIPVACVIFSINYFLHVDGLFRMSLKMITFGMVLYFTIPLSVQFSTMIEETYQTSVQETIQAAEDSSKTIEDSTSEANGDEQGFLSSIISKVQGGIKAITTGFEDILNKFIEAVAVMLITSCAIPIAVLLFFLWIIQMIFHVDIKLPKSFYGKRRIGDHTDLV